MKSTQKKYTWILTLFLSTVLSTSSWGQAFDQEEISPIVKERIKEFIVDHARRMDVLPLSVITPYSPFNVIHGTGPTEPLFPNKRFHYFDVTFDQYRVFYEIKKKAQHLTKDEMIACRSLINNLYLNAEVSPKETAVILTMLFLFEQSRHPWLCGDRVGKNPTVFQFYEKLPPSQEMSDLDWYEMSPFRYETDSTEVAFPAIIFNESYEELLKKRKVESDYLHTKLEILTKKIGLDKTKNHAFKLPSELHEQFPEEAYEIELIIEYLHLVASGRQPTNIDSGNSSLYPKTLGNISRQLIEMRNEMILDAFNYGALWKLLNNPSEQ